MNRLPLRVRLTLAFTATMALILASIGLFVEFRVERSLRSAVDQGLRARAVDVANLASQANNGLSSASDPFATPGESFGQLLDARGRVYDATPALRHGPLLDVAALARARRGPYFLDLGNVLGGPARVFVAPIYAQDQRLVLIVGSSLAREQSAIDGLRTGIMIGGPIALLLTSLGGYLLAGAALRPVERMRARAAGLSADQHGERLPVPPADDEIARLGRTLNELLCGIEQSREREQQFLADASHELRTPLTLLKAELDLALDGPHSPHELGAALRSAGEETDRLVRLAEDLLLLAQFDKGVLPVRTTDIEARELAQRIAARFSLRAATADRRIEIDAPPDLTLHVDPQRIEQALANLTDNALRHGTGTVTLQILPTDTAIEVHVCDQGNGIPAQLRAHAFERFSKADTTRQTAGTGLGLAIVATIAQAHGGEAIVGAGSDIYLRLPGTIARAGRTAVDATMPQ